MIMTRKKHLIGLDLVGLEVELILVNEEGKVVNRADEVIGHPLNSGNILKESTYGVIEVISDPSSSLVELEYLFKKELANLETITNSLSIKAVPISEIGPEDALIKRKEPLRYALTAQALGEDKTKLLNSICGTHIHLDQETDVISQYNLLQSMDPLFVFMSTSPFLRGKNSFNSSRVNVSRNKVFDDSPLHGQLLDYISSLSQIEEQNEKRLAEWLNRLGNDESAIAVYDRDDTCWGPIRLREKNMKTIEMRTADANSLSLVMAMAALYKGVNGYVFGKGLEVRVSDLDNVYGTTGSEIILPSYPTLKIWEQEGIKTGLKSDIVHGYLSYLVDIADGGLPNPEKRYLKPFKEMLSQRKNIADVLYGFARTVDPAVNGKISADAANKVNLFMGQMYQRDLAGKASVLDLVGEKQYC